MHRKSSTWCGCKHPKCSTKFSTEYPKSSTWCRCKRPKCSIKSSTEYPKHIPFVAPTVATAAAECRVAARGETGSTGPLPLQTLSRSAMEDLAQVPGQPQHARTVTPSSWTTTAFPLPEATPSFQLPDRFYNEGERVSAVREPRVPRQLQDVLPQEHLGRRGSVPSRDGGMGVGLVQQQQQQGPMLRGAASVGNPLGPGMLQQAQLGAVARTLEEMESESMRGGVPLTTSAPSCGS